MQISTFALDKELKISKSIRACITKTRRIDTGMKRARDNVAILRQDLYAADA